MAYLPWSASARGAAAGVTAAGVALWDDAAASNQLDTLGAGANGKLLFANANAGDSLDDLGFTAFTKTLVDDTDAATARGTLGAGVGFTEQAKSADFTAADAFSYGIDASGGAIAVTLPACGAGKEIRFKISTIGNVATLTRAGADTIDAGTTYAMSASVKEAVHLVGDASGANWEIH